MNLKVLYFASLRDAAGRDTEAVEHAAGLSLLYDELAARHGFRLARSRVRVAVNGEFVEWDHVMGEGDEVAFLPPVSGG